MVKTVVCTGGIGSGKSYVAQIFHNLGVALYNSDARTKELYLEDKRLSAGLIELLGEEIFKEGELQREVMAKKIFANKTLLERVNALVHPIVLEDFLNWRAAKEREGHTLVLIESAIYLKVPIFAPYIDHILVVTAPLEKKIKRVMERDGLAREMVLSKIASQNSDQEFIAAADFVIDSGGERALLPQIMSFLESINITLNF